MRGDISRKYLWKSAAFLLMIFWVTGNSLSAQSETLDDVRVFQTFLKDAAISKSAYIHSRIFLEKDFTTPDRINLGLQVGLPINKQFEMGADWKFINENPGNTGFADLTVIGRYHLTPAGYTHFSSGGYITLPLGLAVHNQDNIDLGLFGSVRHPVGYATVLSGTVGMDYLDFGDEYRASLMMAGGVLYNMVKNVSFIGELVFESEEQIFIFSSGLDYKLTVTSRLRGMLGFGLDRGSADITFIVGYLHFFD